MTIRPIRFAIVGLGMASRPHLESLADLRGEIEVSGLFDRNDWKVAAACAAHGFPAFDSFDAVVDDPGTDAVIVLTPPNTRTGPIRRLAEAGKHVLCEKPLERTPEAAAEIVRICEGCGVRLNVVFQHRYRPGAIALRRAMDAGDLGEIACVRANLPWWRPQSYYDTPGRGTRDKDGGGVLLTQAIHQLDLMLSLIGPVDEVRAFAATSKLHQMECEDFVTAGFRTRDGVPGSIVATTAGYPGATESLIIDGTRASARLVGGHLTVAPQDGAPVAFGDEGLTGGGADPMAFTCDWHRDLIADFARSIREDTPAPISGRDALKVQRLIDALIRSASEGRTIRLDTGR
ncbi:Gfo/Idh/MocA family protein [Tropicimonas sp.]|uniref:Gfo/Idh/MocA family protein n=1 Tax=Tropicimonas sp. TaxID=2067044 RepID=UPI003A8516F2